MLHCTVPFHGSAPLHYSKLLAFPLASPVHHPSILPKYYLHPSTPTFSAFPLCFIFCALNTAPPRLQLPCCQSLALRPDLQHILDLCAPSLFTHSHRGPLAQSLIFFWSSHTRHSCVIASFSTILEERAGDIVIVEGDTSRCALCCHLTTTMPFGLNPL